MFGALKDGSLQIDSLASNNFSYNNIFQNGIKALSKMVFKNPDFCQKAQNSSSSDHTILFRFISM